MKMFKCFSHLRQWCMRNDDVSENSEPVHDYQISLFGGVKWKRCSAVFVCVLSFSTKWNRKRKATKKSRWNAFFFPIFIHKRIITTNGITLSLSLSRSLSRQTLAWSRPILRYVNGKAYYERMRGKRGVVRWWWWLQFDTRARQSEKIVVNVTILWFVCQEKPKYPNG